MSLRNQGDGSLSVAADTSALIQTGFCHDHALILYVYLSNSDSGAEDAVLTVCVPRTSTPKTLALRSTADLFIASITLLRTAHDFAHSTKPYFVNEAADSSEDTIE